MDTLNREILAKINSSAQKGSYIILSEDDFKEAISAKADGERIQLACKELFNEGYIDLKYSGGGMFCVAPLKDFVEPVPVAETKETEREVVVVKAGTVAAFFAALIGGALGSLITSIISAVANNAF